MEGNPGALVIDKVAEEIAKDIVGTVKLQLNYLCCFSKNIKSMTDEGNSLNAKREDLELRVADRERSTETRTSEVDKWLTDTGTILQQKDDIEAKIRNSESGCWIRMKSRFSLGKKVREITDRMERLRNQQLPTILTHPQNPATRIIPMEDVFALPSRKKLEDDIVGEILSEQKVGNIIGIAGMGGLGKTTLATDILNRLIKDNSFEAVSVVVSQPPVDVLKIQRQIGKRLGLKGTENWDNVHDGACELYSRLEGTQKIIILLDDIWEEIELKKDLGIPCEGGCIVLLTSRNKEILKQMCNKVFEMKTLAPEEAYSLFEEKVGSSMKDLDLGSIGKEIADECDGLPLAIATIASALKNEEKQVWRDALSELKGSEVKGKVYKSLILSYNLLENRNAQTLFLLCCLFPEDYNISLEDLVYFSMGLKMFDGVNSLEEARRKVRGEVRTLKNRYLLLDGRNENEVKMHDVIRDVAISIASKEGLIDVSLRSKEQDDKNCKWISEFTVSSNETLGHLIESNFLDLQLLIIQHIAQCLGDRLEIDDVSILKGMDGLNSLFFRDVEFTSPPERIERLNSLSTLQFQRCNLKTLSFVGKLLNLKILDCSHCHFIEELPVEIASLKCLKLMNLNGCDKLKRIAPGIISRLIELEELKMLESFNGWESSNGDNDCDFCGNCNQCESMNVTLKELEALRKLTCLEIHIEATALVNEEIHLSETIVKYEIHIGISTFAFDNDLEDVEKKLRLNGLPNKINNGSWICNPPIGTKIEWLQTGGSGCDFWGNLSDTSNLKYLQIRNSMKLKELIDASTTASHGFPKLEYLQLRDLSDLTKICDGPIPAGGSNYSDTFNSLHTIQIYRCDKLRNLFLLERATDIFSQLKTLVISDCERLEEVFVSSENNENGKMERSRKAFGKLIELELHLLPRLTSFWKGLESIEFPSLKNLKIQKCWKLKSLVCSPMESANDGKASHLSYKVKFGTLKTLEILCCDNFTAIFSSANVISSLNELYIKSCDKLETIIRMEKGNENEKIHHITFSQLENLRLSKLRNLTSLGEEMDSMEFPVLKKLVIEECSKLMESNEEKEVYFVGKERSIRIPNQRVEFGKPDIVGCDTVNNILCRKNMPSCPFKIMEKLTICGYHKMTTLFSSSVVENLANLSELTIQSCSAIEDVLRMDGQLGLASHAIITFPKLTTINLDYLPSLKCFGKGIERIELPMLKELSIINCPTLRRVISDGTSFSDIREGEGHDGDDGTSFSLFCNQKIKCGGLKILRIEYCHAISSLCSSSMAENFLSCRSLEIRHCDRIKKVITGEDRKDMNSVVFPRLKTMIIENLPLLEMVSECGLELPLLEKASISDCPQMKFLTLAPLRTPKLKGLTITRCDRMEDVLRMDGEASHAIITFPNLRGLYLEDLPSLKCFGKGIESIEFPMLEELSISDCTKLRRLISENIEGDGHDGGDGTSFSFFCTQKVNFGEPDIVGCDMVSNTLCHKNTTMKNMPLCSFKTVETLKISRCNNMRTLFSSSVVENFTNLHELEITSCDRMEDVVSRMDGEASHAIITFPSLRRLHLYGLQCLKSFGKGIESIEFPMLKELKIINCPTLRRVLISDDIREGEEGHDGDDATSFPLFNCNHKIKCTGLETLTIKYCAAISSLCSSSMAAENFLNCRRLEIMGCRGIKKVITSEEGKDMNSVVVRFPSLKELTIEKLPLLEMFSECGGLELPLLEAAEISDCPQMKFLTLAPLPAPKLKTLWIDRKLKTLWIDTEDIRPAYLEDLNSVVRFPEERN